MGYWISDNKIGDRQDYTEFAFFNNGVFKVSLVRSDYQKSTWEKTGINTYKITESKYDAYYSKKFSEPFTSTFTINPDSNMATYQFTNRRGEVISSTWYYKGKAYSIMNKSKEEILTPVPVKLD